MWSGSAKQGWRVARAALAVVMGLALSGCAVTSLFKSHKGEPGADAPYPTLGSVPERPPESESALDRRKLAEGLIADRTRVKYTDEALRGGTEASAPPPPPPITATPDDSAARPAAMGDAAFDEPVTERPGFFARLLGSKEKESRNLAATPNGGEAPASDAVSAELDARAKASAGLAAGAPLGGVEEGTGATEIGKGNAESENRGLFRRLFKGKKDRGTDAPAATESPPPPAAEALPMTGTMAAGEEESTGAAVTREASEKEARRGLFRRLFGGKKSTESESDPAP